MAIRRRGHRPRAISTCLVAATALGGGGCGAPRRSALVDNYATIPPGAVPAPIGTLTKGVFDTQAQKAEEDDFVFYLREWAHNAPESLGPGGRRHLTEMVARLPTVACPAIIEPSDDPELDDKRRVALIESLARGGVLGAETRVVVGYPKAEGLYGDEAPRIYSQMIRVQGGNNGNGNGGLGGLGGGGLGGGLGGGGLGGLGSSGFPPIN